MITSLSTQPHQGQAHWQPTIAIAITGVVYSAIPTPNLTLSISGGGAV